MAVPYLDLPAQHAALRDELRPALDAVFGNASFVLGPAVERFESSFAQYCGCRHAIGVNSGTSALHLALLHLGARPDTEVIVPAMTFVATAMAVAYTGATPVFADIDSETFTLDPAAAEAAITPRTIGIVPVHLYGQPARVSDLQALCSRRGLFLLEDAAQAHGAEVGGRRCGTFGAAACFSFYPGKNLGAAGEAGAIVTNDTQLAESVRRLRDWGQRERYRHETIAFNYRMEGLQGAVLGVKLRHIEEWTERRRAVARAYDAGLAGLPDLALPRAAADLRHVYHIYAVRHPRRDALRTALGAAGIQTGLHYPVPLHLQPCFAALGGHPGQFPVAEALAREELSLPIYPELTPTQIAEVCAAIRRTLS